LYAQARHIDNENDRVAVLSRALELELFAETCVIGHRTSDGEEKA
jgi:hypothetical protein